jgi:hypothetical protein
MSREEIQRAAVAAGAVLDWSKQKIDAEVQACITYAFEKHLVTVD